jgi:hypothetical protein
VTGGLKVDEAILKSAKSAVVIVSSPHDTVTMVCWRAVVRAGEMMDMIVSVLLETPLEEAQRDLAHSPNLPSCAGSKSPAQRHPWQGRLSSRSPASLS